MLLLVPKFLDLLGELPIHEVAFALGPLLILVAHVADNVRPYWAVRWEQFLDGTRLEVNTRLGHHRVYHAGRTLELCATGGVIAHTRALEAFLVLLVPLFACLFVVLDQLDILERDLGQFPLGHLLGHVAVEVLVLLGTLELVHADDSGAVRLLLDLGKFVVKIDDQTFLVLGTGSCAHRVLHRILHGVLREFYCHGSLSLWCYIVTHQSSFHKCSGRYTGCTSSPFLYFSRSRGVIIPLSSVAS